MNVVPMQDREHAISSRGSDDVNFAIHDSQAIPSVGTEPIASYSLDTNEPWPDQGLNRILATIDNYDIDALNEIECLEMMVYLSSKRQDARSIAELAIETYGSLAKVFQQPGNKLRGHIGMDHSMTAMLAIAKSSIKYILAPELSNWQEIRSYDALMNYVTVDLRGLEQEVLRIIYLDTKCRIIKEEELARGTVNAVSIYPREVARRAAALCASTVILAHNHLSDDPRPSPGDRTATHQTKRALENFDIILRDHVIVARSSCFSMEQAGLI